MIVIALGANLPSPIHGAPLATLKAALAALEGPEISVAAVSRWYETAPVPVSDQPWYVNGAARLDTSLAPAELLARLHDVEAAFGRVRAEVNAPRVLDLDLLAYDGLVLGEGWPVVPHPRLHERAFVLLPLRDVAPDWIHPVLGQNPQAMIAALPPGQATRLLQG